MRDDAVGWLIRYMALGRASAFLLAVLPAHVPAG